MKLIIKFYLWHFENSQFDYVLGPANGDYTLVPKLVSFWGLPPTYVWFLGLVTRIMFSQQDCLVYVFISVSVSESESKFESKSESIFVSVFIFDYV